jgi:hypothetical protein
MAMIDYALWWLAQIIRVFSGLSVALMFLMLFAPHPPIDVASSFVMSLVLLLISHLICRLCPPQPKQAA